MSPHMARWKRQLPETLSSRPQTSWTHGQNRGPNAVRMACNVASTLVQVVTNHAEIG